MKKYKTHNNGAKWCGGFLLGHIECSYDFLIDKFGEPHNSDGYKSDAEWEIEFEDGIQCCIYNYKTGKNYLGKDGLNKEDTTEWNIGGHNPKVIEIIKEIKES